MNNTRKVCLNLKYITLPVSIWLCLIIFLKFSDAEIIADENTRILFFSVGFILLCLYTFISVYEISIAEYRGFLKRLDRESKEILSGKRIKIFFRKRDPIEISEIKRKVEIPLENSIRIEKAFQQWNYTIEQLNYNSDIKALVKAEKAIRGAINNENLCRFF